MSLWKIAWRSIQRRGFASVLTAMSMALGVLLVVAVLLIHGVVEQSFHNNSGLGYNMIVGAKGGKLQLVLNTVFYLSQPVENIPYSYYQEFLGADEIEQYRLASGVEELGEVRDGKFEMFTKFAIPMCLGDYYGQFRVIGTTPQLFDNFVYDVAGGNKYEFSQGRNFQVYNNSNGYFECVVGSKVARDKRLKIGAKISATHGDPDGELHDEHPFTVVGILNPSGTPNDRGVFVNMEGFYLMDGHAKPMDEEADRDGTEHSDDVDAHQDADTGVPAEIDHDRQLAQHGAKRHRPIPLREREVTAILVRTVNQLVTAGISNTINEGPDAQAVLPIGEIYGLFSVIVRPIQRALLCITILICIVSGVSILVSIYNSMNERQHEIAVMRALGAGRGTVMTIVLLESIILSLGGGLFGWVGAHVLSVAASPVIEDQTGVSIGFLDLSPPVNALAAIGVMVGLVGLLTCCVSFFIIAIRTFRLNLFWGLLALLVPFAVFGAVIKFWDEHKLAFHIGLVGLAMLLLVTVMWAISLVWPTDQFQVPSELVVIPGLILLAVLAGFLPALAAYRTDVSRVLSGNP